MPRLFILIFFVFSSCSQVALRENETKPRFESALRFFSAQYPMPVSTSPDGSKVLMKTRHEKDFEISVIEKKSGMRIATSKSPDTQLSLTWSPDGEQIAFLSDHAGDKVFRLHLWNYRNKDPTEYPDASTQTAAPPLRWSPFGHIAFFSGGSGQGSLQILQFSPEGKVSILPVAQTLSFTDFAWAPNGKELAYVPSDELSAVEIIRLESGDGEKSSFKRRIQTKDIRVKIREIAWTRDGESLLVSLRDGVHDFWKMAIMNGTDKKESEETQRSNRRNRRSRKSTLKNIAQEPFDLERPYCMLQSPLCAFEANREGVREIWTLDLNTQRVKRLYTQGHLIGANSDGRSAFFYASPLDSPPFTAELNLETTRMRILGESPRFDDREQFKSVAPKIGRLQDNRGEVPYFFWKSRSTEKKASRTVILFVHGGPHLQESPVWDSKTQWLLSEGIDIFTVNYKGSKGYGARFEKSEDLDDQALDLLQAREFLIRQQGYLPEKIVIMTSSYGSAVALRALALNPGVFDFLIFTALTPPLDADCVKARRDENGPPRILAFQGEKDPFKPSTAKASLERCFGDELFQKSENRWLELSGEGHYFQKSGSWAKVYAEILNAVHPIKQEIKK